MIKGVTQAEEVIIKSILSQYSYDFYYYGSRVKGDYTKSSDLDILLKSKEEVPYTIIEEIELKFNESNLPYIVNISQYSKMDNKFYTLIEKELVKV